jgi:GTP-dependent dephospho-CoA kinase
MPADGTRSVSSDEEGVWVVPAALRPRLAEEYGPVYSGAEADRRIRDLKVFGSCGDMVTAQALRLGKSPLVAIVDYKTKRHDPVDPTEFSSLAQVRVRKVRNPPGMLTEALRTAVHDLVFEGGGLIVVDGEEDLGSLALVDALPSGATVIYGIPGAGVSFVPVNARTKDNVRALIAQMEYRKVPLGR